MTSSVYAEQVTLVTGVRGKLCMDQSVDCADTLGLILFCHLFNDIYFCFFIAVLLVTMVIH